jgi:hypothetical protein
VAPSIWVPGKSTLKRSPGVRELDNTIGEWDEARVTTEPTKVKGGLSLEVAPGREAILIAMLTRKTRRTMNSATVTEALGDVDGFATAGVTVNTATMKCAKGEDLMVDFDCIGRSRARVAPAIPNFNAPPAPYVFEELLAMVRGGNEYHLETVELGIDHQCKDDKYGSDGTGLLREVPTDGRKISLKLDHQYEHPDLWDAAMARQWITAVMRFTRADNYFTWTFPACIIMEGDIEEGMQPLELKACRTQTAEAVSFAYGG